MHNNQNFRGYGINQTPSSSRSFYDRDPRDDRWQEETEWSTKDETWRGNPRHNEPPIRGRNESWKGSSPPMHNDFRLGIDRAPMPVDDQFLDRYGAKRLNNGNLVDRDGYTLRTRDPDCRAPSPPNFNPGREMRRSHEGSRQSCMNSVARMSEAELEKKARQQMGMQKIQKMAEENIAKNGGGARRNGNDRKKETPVKKNPEDVEGEDEYEEVDLEPPVKEPRVENNFKKTFPRPYQSTAVSPNSTIPYNNIKKTLIPSGPPQVREESWMRQYKRGVDEMKMKVYGPPAGSSTASPGYHYPPNHQPPPQNYYGVSPSFGTPPASTSSPYYPPSSGYNPFGAPIPQAKPKPFQMDLPPPGIVALPPRSSPGPSTSSRYPGSQYPPTGTTNYPHTSTAPASSAPSSLVNAFGVFTGVAPVHVPLAPIKFPDAQSSDSESEDEAILKLREIIRNHGTR